MNIGFVVTTLGRLEPLRALLTSLEAQLRDGDHVVLVAQGAQDAVAELAREFAARGVAVTATVSERGASLGRNTGVAALPAGEAVVTFPNDNTTYPAGTVEALHAAVDDQAFRAGGFTSWDERGPKTTLPAPGTPLDKYNVWAVIEMGILMRRSLFDAVGGFSEAMGPGSATPWQVAEGTDLLLRAMAYEPSLERSFRWLPAHVHVDGISTGFGLTTAERRRKLRAYGRGTGRAFATHGYPLWWRAAFTGAGLLYGVRNPRPISVLDGWPMFLGRLEGALGRTFGQARMVSTTR
ncbi:glycosyltransferase family 2 protein [Microbacterium testaceum]|uniref:glycosyltransferase family 2 protein n=1 Tax=Microbacterium testaceum TaxID=2033 RepID=UPI0022E97FBA|nr:glycosyltransferase [Microbacterium testaceum]